MALLNAMNGLTAKVLGIGAVVVTVFLAGWGIRDVVGDAQLVRSNTQEIRELRNAVTQVQSRVANRELIADAFRTRVDERLDRIEETACFVALQISEIRVPSC